METTSNKLTGKDLINVGIYSAIYFVIVFIIAMLGMVPVLYPIYVIREGEIAEQGSFAELTGQKGLFASMWENYQKSVEWSV